MRTIVINTGTEILLGDVVNTHLAFLARQLLKFGLRIEKQITIPDGDAIAVSLREAFLGSELIFVTGGLGPTTDDITRDITASVMGMPLADDPEVMAAIAARARLRRFPVTERMRLQAQVPVGATVLPNNNGTAPGLYFPPRSGKSISSPHLFLLPGPPRELYPMFRDFAVPILRRILPPTPDFSCRTLLLSGIGESLVEQAVGDQLAALGNIELGYCSRPGQVDVRLIGRAAAVQQAEAIIREKLAEHIFSSADESLEEVLLLKLREQNATLATAESCTGGLLAHRLTNVPGSSAVFLAGYVSYANEAKTDLFGILPSLMEEEGAVSEAVAWAMAEKARQRAGSTYALATTGVAGPEGGSPNKPVGTVFLALATPHQTLVKQYNFASDRETFKQLCAQNAFNLLRQQLEK